MSVKSKSSLPLRENSESFLCRKYSFSTLREFHRIYSSGVMR